MYDVLTTLMMYDDFYDLSSWTYWIGNTQNAARLSKASKAELELAAKYHPCKPFLWVTIDLFCSGAVGMILPCITSNFRGYLLNLSCLFHGP